MIAPLLPALVNVWLTPRRHAQRHRLSNRRDLTPSRTLKPRTTRQLQVQFPIYLRGRVLGTVLWSIACVTKHLAQDLGLMSLTSCENGVTPPHPRALGWFGTTALAMGGSNQMIFLITALFVGQGAIIGQGSAAVPLLIFGVLLGWAAAPAWTELVLMWPNRVGGISAACAEAFRPYNPVLSALTGTCYWWGGFRAASRRCFPLPRSNNGIFPACRSRRSPSPSCSHV